MAASPQTSPGVTLAWVLDFEQYAPACIYIQDKGGKTIRLKLNETQRRFRQQATWRNVI